MIGTLAILSYHKIGAPSAGGWETWYYVPEEIFEHHLAYLRDRDWEVIDLNTLLRAVEGSHTLSPRSALLTFDDGYRSVHDRALPMLIQFGCPAVLFVPTRFIGGSNDFDAGAEPSEPVCNWDQLHELERNHVSIQSHGVSHRSFSDLSPREQEEELAESKRVLEAGIRKPITLFAYPYGDAGTDADGTAMRLQSAGYHAACLYDGQVNSGPLRRPYFLSRLSIGPETDLENLLGPDCAVRA